MQMWRDSAGAGLAASLAHLLLLAVAARIGSPAAWQVCLMLIALISFVAWILNFKRNRVIADTPTSRVDSAAQGYVELFGHASREREYLASNQLGGLPCVWYRFVTYERTADNKWREISRGASDTLFALEDGSGTCLIDPDHAEVKTTHRRTWHEGQYKHVEEMLKPGDALYALGEFSTVGGASTVLDARADVSALLAEWKRDQPTLLKRFDLDGDGSIDVREWELARRQAQREVERQHRELRQQKGVHVMRAPSDGRLFLLSNLSPAQLKLRYVLWGWFHLLVLGAAVTALVLLGLDGLPPALW